MAIVVLRELREELSEDLGPGDPVSRIEAIHAAPADPETPGDVDDRTFRGKPTEHMERVNYQPQGPGVPRLPPNTRPWECSGCADALRPPRNPAAHRRRLLRPRGPAADGVSADAASALSPTTDRQRLLDGAAGVPGDLVTAGPRARPLVRRSVPVVEAGTPAAAWTLRVSSTTNGRVP